MNIFNIITLFGGLAMFLYGMRLMGDGLKESSSGALKSVMEKVTGTPLKAFLLGLVMTAVIQSSTATIVITSGLVGAGIISLHQSLGIIVGANVGTTVTGQIIRLLDLNTNGGASFLQFFKPSTLAPLALIIGIIIVMSGKLKNGSKIGQIIIGFGILFSGLLNMTDAVGTLTESGIIENLFSRLGENPLIGYVIGTGVAFVLQSSSAAIGILQAFSTSGQLTFNAIYAVLMGIYLGDCVTTAIVCNIGAKPDSKRVGVVNILFNLCKTALILVGVNVAHRLGLLDGLWNSTVYSGAIANTNTVFNLTCALLMLPMLGVYEKMSRKLVKDAPADVAVALPAEPRALDALNPVFFSTPALALNSCYKVLMQMFNLARENVNRAFDLLKRYDAAQLREVRAVEDEIDHMADRATNYMVQLSGHVNLPGHTEIMDQYYAAISDFERLGDHAMNIADYAEELRQENTAFSEYALKELHVLRGLIGAVMGYTGKAFEKCDVKAARHIEPLEEVVDDMVNALKQNHLDRLRERKCSVLAGTEFLNLLSDIERISDICSNVGVATIARMEPELKHEIHDYVSRLHAGKDENFNREYHAAHDHYFAQLRAEEDIL